MISSALPKFDALGKLIDSATAKQLRKMLLAQVAWSQRPSEHP